MTKNPEMTKVVKKAAELNNDLVLINKELKRLASIKCRLKKMPGRKDYESEMTKVLKEEQLIKNVRDYVAGPKKNVNNVTSDEVAKMDYDEVCKAIRSIQSKKTHTKWAEDCKRDDEGNFIPGSGESYLEACRIEQMLIARRNEVKPVDDEHIRKTDLMSLLDEIKLASDMTVEECVRRLEKFITEA